ASHLLSPLFFADPDSFFFSSAPDDQAAIRRLGTRQGFVSSHRGDLAPAEAGEPAHYRQDDNQQNRTKEEGNAVGLAGRFGGLLSRFLVPIFKSHGYGGYGKRPYYEERGNPQYAEADAQ